MSDKTKQKMAASALIRPAQMKTAKSEEWEFLSDLYTGPLDGLAAILDRLHEVVPDEYISLAVAAKMCLGAINERIKEVTQAVEKKYGRQAATVSYPIFVG